MNNLSWNRAIWLFLQQKQLREMPTMMEHAAVNEIVNGFVFFIFAKHISEFYLFKLFVYNYYKKVLIL